MWAASNKLLQARMEKEKYQTHRQHLQKLGAVIRISQPLAINRKFCPESRAEHQRQLEILRRKLRGLKPDPKLCHQVPPSKHPKPQPLTERLQNDQINEANKFLCWMLQNIKSYYPHQKLEAEFKAMMKTAENIKENARRFERKDQRKSSNKKLRRCSSAIRDNRTNWNINSNGIPDRTAQRHPQSASTRSQSVAQLDHPIPDSLPLQQIEAILDDPAMQPEHPSQVNLPSQPAEVIQDEV